MMEKETLEYLLKITKAKHIGESELYELLDFPNVEKEKQPKILLKEKAIIIFDNSDFNCAIILDLFYHALAERNEKFDDEGNSITIGEYFNFDNIPLYYVNDTLIRMKIFAPKMLQEIGVENVLENEKEILPKLNTTILLVNPEIDSVLMIEEILEPLQIENILACYGMLKNNFNPKNKEVMSTMNAELVEEIEAQMKDGSLGAEDKDYEFCDGDGDSEEEEDGIEVVGGSDGSEDDDDNWDYDVDDEAIDEQKPEEIDFEEDNK